MMKISSIFITVFLIGYFTYLIVNTVAKHHQNIIQAEFVKLTNYVRDTADADEILYNACQAKPRNNTIIYTNFISLRQSFRNLVNQHATLGRLVSLKTYCMIHTFTSWSNQLQSDIDGMCQAVRPGNPINIERNAILDQIYQDMRQRQGIWSSFIEYFTHIQYKKYKPEDCRNL